MKQISRGDDSEILRSNSVASGAVDPELVPGAESRTQADEDAEIAHLNKVAKFARWLTVFMTVALLVLWPMPMYGSNYIFSKNFFTGKYMFQNLTFMALISLQDGLSLVFYGFSSARCVLVSFPCGREGRLLHILSSLCSLMLLASTSLLCKDASRKLVTTVEGPLRRRRSYLRRPVSRSATISINSSSWKWKKVAS